MKSKFITIFLLMVLGTAFMLMPSNIVRAQAGLNISGLFPGEFGKVGEEIRLEGSITTSGGQYQVLFGSQLVASSNAVGTSVTATFKVPGVLGGDYVVTLKDVSSGSNVTVSFTVLEGYSINAVVPAAPELLREGSNVVLNATLTGGRLGVDYIAEITVQLPSPLFTNYSRQVTLTPSGTGTAHVEVIYQDPAFTPSGSSTILTGLYHVYLNASQLLAEDEFFISLLDASEYHRGQSVKIHAVGYQPNQPSTVEIKYEETSVSVHTASVPASAEGVVDASWTIPDNAVIGIYDVTVTPEGVLKSINDSQSFNIPGYPTMFRLLNLAGDLVPQITVEALDQATGETYTGISGDDGIAIINLEKGGHTVDSFWNDVKVGEISVSITGQSTRDLICKLINLKIVVQDKNGFTIPFVALDVAFQYLTTKQGASRTWNVSGQTDILGAFSLNSTLPGVVYTIDASVYGTVFNSGDNTFSNIPEVPTFQVTILLPTQSLALRILDYNLEAIPNARLALAEQTSGIFYAALTDDAGAASLEVALGKYQLKVYVDDILLNETTIEVFVNTQAEVRCILYNLQVSVLVVDYFGQAIPNVNVIFRGPDMVRRLNITQADGIASFGSVIGGEAQVIAYVTETDSYYEAVNLQVESPTALRVRMGKYVLLGSLLVETSLFTTIVIVFIAVVLFLSLEVYRRNRFIPFKPRVPR